MPRVEPESQSHRSWWQVAALSGMTVVMVLSSFVGYVGLNLVKPAKAMAAGSELPGPVCPATNCMSDQPMYSVVSDSNTTNVIEAPDDYAKIYFDPSDGPNGAIQIFNAPFNPCGQDESDLDFARPVSISCSIWGTIFSQINYTFYATDANEKVSAFPMFTLNGQTGTRSDGGAAVSVPTDAMSGNIDINLASIPVSKLTGYKVVYVHTTFFSYLGGGSSFKNHAYKLFTTSPLDLLGYVNTPPTFFNTQPASGQMIIHTTNPGVWNYEANFELDFAPSCDVTADQNETIRWYDADNVNSATLGGHDGDQFAGDKPVNFTFYQIPPSGPPITKYIADGTSPDIGGNNTYEFYPFVAHPGWKYRWVWNNVNSSTNQSFGGPPNNIMMWIPYDSINYLIGCWNYHNQIAPAAGQPANGAKISPSVTPQVTLDLTASNILGAQGPAGATLNPIATVNGSGSAGVTRLAGSWSNPLPAIPGNSSVPGGQVTFTLDSALLNNGDVVCFSDSITPHDSGDPGPQANDPPDVCYTITTAIRFPSVVGERSDIHAGGGVCNGSQSTGNVDTNPKAGSYGDYVVSASGSINGMGSNGSPTDNSLYIGPNYAEVCRPDLYSNAANNLPTGASWVPSNGSYDLSTDFTGEPEMTLVDGGKAVAYISGDVDLHGNWTQNYPLTIVATGTVTISNDINVSATGVDRVTVPSVGILAGGGINITSAAANVDAFLFTDSPTGIDTCFYNPPWVSPECDNTLTVHGFLMAPNILLHRLGS